MNILPEETKLDTIYVLLISSSTRSLVARDETGEIVRCSSLWSTWTSPRKAVTHAEMTRAHVLDYDPFADFTYSVKPSHPDQFEDSITDFPTVGES